MRATAEDAGTPPPLLMEAMDTQLYIGRPVAGSIMRAGDRTARWMANQ